MVKCLQFALLLLVLGILSCKASKTVTYNKVRSVTVDPNIDNAFRYSNRELPIDSVVYRALIRAKRSEACAEKIAFSKSTLEMVELSTDHHNFRHFDYGQCRATLHQDTLLIRFNFGLYAGGNISYFAGRPLELTISKGKYQPKITHTSDVVAMIKQGDKYVRKPFPTSDFMHSRLSLAQTEFAVGDTLRGDFYGRALAPSRRNKQARRKEILQGGFRVIIEDPEQVCR